MNPLERYNIMCQLLTILIVGAIIFMVTACDLKHPDTEGVNPNCRAFLECMYLNQRNPDKSVCDSLGKGCKRLNDYVACTKDGKTDRDCLLLLKD